MNTCTFFQNLASPWLLFGGRLCTGHLRSYLLKKLFRIEKKNNNSVTLIREDYLINLLFYFWNATFCLSISMCSVPLFYSKRLKYFLTPTHTFFSTFFEMRRRDFIYFFFLSDPQPFCNKYFRSCILLLYIFFVYLFIFEWQR